MPEIADGLVDIRGVAREPGYRSKIAVESHAQGVDPVGACVGPRGSRVRMVVSELRGEKIDIIPWNPEPARFVAKALSPARVREVYLDDEAKEATVVVPDDQLALAIGKEGMNARLAHRLTGWKIDIVSDTEFAQQEADAAYGGGEPGDEGDTRAAARRSSRTASAARTRRFPGSKYCGVPAHQELALHAPATTRSRTRSSTSRSPSSRRWPTSRRPRRCRSTPRCSATRAGEEFPAGPGDAPVGGADETLESGERRRSARRGRPERGRADRVRRRRRRGGSRRRVTGNPIRTCAGCGRKAPQARAPALPRGGRRRSQPARAPAAVSTPAAGSRASSARPRGVRSTERCARPSVVDPDLARLYT